VRLLLAADVAIGCGTALLVLVQATLLARIIAGSYSGSTLADLRPLVGLLLVVFAGRAGLAWAFEAVGRLAATSVLSRLRLDLAARRFADDPAALDGAQSADLAAAGVYGATALETYFGRFLPQLVLAAVVPVAVLLWILPIDIASAAIMLVTLPLVAVFMVLVGGYTAQRTRERANALGLLATQFMGVVRGLPTLRAFNRSRAQTEVIAERSDAYRQATLGTLRVVSSDARFIAASVDTADYEVVLDARAHTLSIGGRVISLKNRQVVRGILYGFAREPGHFLGKELLAEAAWGVEYDPRVHDGALKVNLLRLRGLLRDTGLTIEHDSDGYRLRGLGKFLFVEPLNR